MERRTTTNPELELDALEAHLAGMLKPVSPPGDLIQRLRERIRFPARDEITMRLQDWRKLFLVIGGVMSMMLILITVARALFHLVGRKHI